MTLELTDIELEVLRECLWMAKDEGLWTLDTLEDADDARAAFDTLSEKMKKAEHADVVSLNPDPLPLGRFIVPK